MKKLILLLIFIINLYSNQNFTQSQTFILPDESGYLKEKIRYEILSSRDTIFLAMYNFSYKSIAKDLIKASKNGVKITVLLDKEKVESQDEIYNMLKDAKINVILADKKMHLKMMLIDKKQAMIGSLNFTKKSFEDNYEIVYFSKDRSIINRLNEFVAKFE
ncbi:nuclease [Aliarcobacter trophiarum LMG 25534]|uniref:phospholipase D n=1 Tax=Aliarcobacter trophiarum LMG 25534 TaxID=1032241 RepID=A0AAD0VMF7_9BACT|nr:phospholipase D-like domain-containing protein [Aliarcobacter trophiarum]AXK48871.1 nuclease NucT [Aliarcobacter trophiarum LMG 25534]RXJ92606.1 nuclease [Aliarcobacter trophiarum LMG 25534]